jgi:hypothetical protein
MWFLLGIFTRDLPHVTEGDIERVTERSVTA